MFNYGQWSSKEPREDDHIGFVYLIINKLNQRKYIGKKLLYSKISKPPNEGKINRKRFIKDSDWLTYTGSSKELNNDILKFNLNNFEFFILKWCKDKTELNYEELKEIVFRDAINNKDYYNKWVYCKIYGNKIK